MSSAAAPQNQPGSATARAWSASSDGSPRRPQEPRQPCFGEELRGRAPRRVGDVAPEDRPVDAPSAEPGRPWPAYDRTSSAGYRRPLATPIDLRSDTVTRPTPRCARRWPRRQVGDDQFGEDPSDQPRSRSGSPRCSARRRRSVSRPGRWPTRSRSEPLTRPGRRGARRRARATPSGTRPAARRRTSGVQFTEIGARRAGSPPTSSSPPGSRAATCSSRRRRSSRSRTRTTGPAAWSSDVATSSRDRRGAPASTASRLPRRRPAAGTRRPPAACDAAELAAPFDLVAVAFSKGLGAPGGSMLAGIARRHRGGRPLPADGRRRDAPGRHLRRGRRVRARPPPRAARRGPRQRPRCSAERLAAQPGDRARPGGRPDEHRRLPARRRRARRADRRAPRRARPACSSSRSRRGRSAPSPTST